MPELSRESVSVFAPAATAELGARIAAALGLPVGKLEETTYTGGERKLRPLESVRGRSVYVVQSMFGDAQGSANDRLCSLLFLIGALKDAGARRVSACIPYLAYARQERRAAARDPVTTRYTAQLFEAVGVDQVIALEVHDRTAFDNSFRCAASHLKPLLYSCGISVRVPPARNSRLQHRISAAPSGPGMFKNSCKRPSGAR